MSKKDLFKSQNPNKFIASANLDKLKEQVESKDFIKEKIKQQSMFTPKADFSDPANFARYGLAEEYYRTSMENLYKTYPYDGSLAEKEAWYNRGSYLDQYIFDNEYPRSTGYIIIGDGTWGTSTVTVDYGLPSTLEYITLNGGPHKAFDPAGPRTGSLANYYKSSKNRENNLKLDLSTGATVEFWLKKGGFNNALTKRETIFDLWNGSLSSSAGYGRLSIEMSASATASDPVFRVTCQSGTVGCFNRSLGSTTVTQASDGAWHHYGFSFVSASGGVKTTLYVDGQYAASETGDTAFSEIAGTMSASIGALRTSPSGNVYHGVNMTGSGKVLSSSIDEFRYWKTERTSKQIFQNYNNQVGGGTNTDDANTTLGVYYKFNEGITTNDSVDATVLDYSGRVSNGDWVGYASTGRNTGSAFISSSASSGEFEDPIIYSFHPTVSSTKDRLVDSGSFHDNSNASALFYTMPSWILEDDESYGGENLKYLTQIMASYLDTLYLQIEGLTEIKEVEYTSGSLKPSVFGGRTLSDKGLLAPDLFVDADIIEQLYNRNEKTSFSKDLSEIKNKIYENVYNNLVQIYKSKGTYSSFRNILNTLGISQKIVDINLYSNNLEYEILDNRKLVSERKKKVNFFKSDYNSATVYQSTGSLGYGNIDQTLSYIPATNDNTGSFTPWTMESRFTLPRDNINSNYYFIENNILSCSLFGFHQPYGPNPDRYTWASDDTTIQVYAVRDKSSYKDGYFYLSSSALAAQPGTVLSSSVIPNLFDDTEWNLAVRFVPVKNPLETAVSGGLTPSDIDVSTTMYNLELKGVSLRGDLVENEFVASASLDHSATLGGLYYSLTNKKRFYLGAHRTNWTGSVYNSGHTFAKFHNFNFWLNYVSDDDVKSHLKDSKNYGLSKTYQPSPDSFFERDGINSAYPANGEGVPNIDTLALRWDFETVTGSDANGQFVALDTTTAGSTSYKYGTFGSITKQYQYPARGDFFAAGATDVVKSEYINSHKLANFDTITAEQMIEIRSEDDEIFLPDKRPIEYFLAAEKSFYGAINENILETFSTMKDFNNLVGESANRYRPEYKELKKYRQLYFQRVQNDLDFERFVDYYKWVDSSITHILAQVMPASADFSPDLSNMVESHVLERNKYQHKLPVIKPIIATLATISVAPDSFKYSKKGLANLNFQNENPITASSFLSGSLSVASGIQQGELSGTIENIVDTTYRNITTGSYISGSENINSSNIPRVSLKNKKVGNFSDNTSVVIIPNKDGNNDFLQDMFHTVTPVADSFYVSGVVDYTLPTRPSQPSVITSRFSAPGGPEVNSLGYLDYESAQYSVYNNLNYRNLVVRKALDEMRGTASLDPTLFPNAASASSFNHNYRNPRREMVSGTASPGNTSSVFYDNAYVNFGTPASDLQYSWITASYESATFLTRQVGSEDITWPRFLKSVPPSYGDEIMPVNIPFMAVFMDARAFASKLDDSDGLYPLVAKEEWSYPVSENLYSLFSVQNSIGTTGEYNPGSYPNNTNYTPLARGTAAFGGATINNQEGVRYYLNSISAYGFVPWTMLRNRDSKQVLRIFNKHNVLSVADPIKERTVIDTISTGARQKQTFLGIVPNTITNYIEPPITRKFKPVVHTLVRNNKNSDVFEVITPYAIQTVGFANKNLDERFHRRTSREVSSYNDVKNLYLNSVDPASSEIKGWISVEYSEMVWPKEKFQGVNSHRDKPNYDAGQFPYIYASRLCDSSVRTFWRDSADDRKRKTTDGYNVGILGNMQNSLGIIYGLGEGLGDGPHKNGDPFTKNIFPLSDYSLADNTGSLGQICEVQLTIAATITSSATVSVLEVGFLDLDQVVTDREIKGSDIAGTATAAALLLEAAINSNATYSSALTASIPSAGVLRIQTRYPIAISGSDYLGSNLNTNYIDTSPFAGKITPNGKIYLSGGTAPIINRDGEINSSFLSLPGTTLASGVEEKNQGYREEGYFGTHGYSSKHYPDRPVHNRPIYSYYYPQASQTYIHRPRPALSTGLVEVAPYSGHPWRVAQSASRNPFFDSYEQYVKFPKMLTENYSIISEFNISEQLPYYEQLGNNFRAENKRILDLPGAKGKKLAIGSYQNTSSAETETGAYNAGFFRNYVNSEFLQKFDPVQRDHDKVGQIGEVTLVCKAFKKFRPKQGFYPVQRCVQMGSLLSQSLESQLAGTTATSVKYGYELEQFKIQSAIQPFFSPGILYNSIKAGIAVDWPIIFSGSLTAVGNKDLLPSSSLVINSDASKRVPFEALTDLSQYPRNLDVDYLYPSYHSGTVAGTQGARRPFFNWNGTKNTVLFEAAMDNFLAEVPNFYLENKNYTEFTSVIEDKFKPFESGKTYYMDVSVRQTDKHTMWRDYFDGTVANAQSFTGSYNGRAFGPGWNTASADPAGKRIGSDPSYAPYTPPYFYGESLARISFAPTTSRKYTLDEIVAESSVEYLTPNLLTGVSASTSIGVFDGASSTSPAYTNRMTLSSSFALFNKIRTKPDSPDTSFNAWRISPKFECPILNFDSQPSEQYMSRGMWGGLGVIASGSEGIFASIRDSFTGSILSTTASLADQLGFTRKEKKLGNISAATVLEEAIIAIPYLERKSNNKGSSPSKDTSAIEKVSESLTPQSLDIESGSSMSNEAELTTIDKRNFFKIDRTVLDEFREKDPAKKNNSINKMTQMMDKYVIPPRFNFLKYKDITPFVMYFFEFSETFTKQDLAYMWQGVMPDASLDGNEKFDEIGFTHKTGPNEFYHGKKIPSDIRWAVFKVKKKARKSYSDVISLVNEDEQDYGYNWPYDYCSLVEMAKLDVSLKITPKKDVEDEKDIIIGKVLEGE